MVTGQRRSFLIVGGDSLVASGVMQALVRRGHEAIATTRRRDALNNGRVYLDFEDKESFVAGENVGYAFVIAAATNYDRCETDPVARKINVELIPRTIASLLAQDIFVTFISTNSVFGGEKPWPREDDMHDPGIAYARQKSEGEEAVRAAARRFGASDRLNIVRLTKVMNADVPPLPTWLECWKHGQVVTPFADLIFAPISVRFVGEALATIGEKRISGNLHVSGAENVNYVAFAHALARRLGVSPQLIQPTTAVERGVHIAFKPSFSGLGMERTTRLSGVAPQPLENLIEDIFADIAKQEDSE